ncbi:endonuclease III [Candidatus Neptunochlamydia vexilliferae]|uniref:Endonuclease III n=1 Tax=Candidatus Neptunichlamydia vexilliferae TaxID=1651774 RepID=A0ABS0AX88_9BACT|nr:endonuclease III [Candidatus Neptunochlamydia vexilliferae]MBF5058756.1 Endonuclease III [Candidatus Neptunochlamydia vexilliferae]
MSKAETIQKILDELFPDPPIPLKHQDHYTLLIAVLLSAQCTDKKVNEITPTLFSKASTPAAMAQLPVSEIETIIRPCGLAPTKARNIQKLSQILVDTHQGKVPSTLEELEKLPGVGHKTASVVLIQAFDTPAFPVDTHIHRCAHRWGLSSGKNVEQTEKDLKALFPESSWKKLHLQIIYYAREYCPAKKHQVDTCPICTALK